MSFQQGVSGLNAAAVELDVIGNNIANANTVGFRGSRAEFGDMYFTNLYGVGSPQIGLGVDTQDVTVSTKQGSTIHTQRGLDIAIDNNGYFVMRTNVTPGSPSSASGTTSSLAYSRNGQFQLDADGFINHDGNRLQGWVAHPPTGIINQGALTDLQVTSQNMTPNATTKLQFGINLDSRLPSLEAGGTVPAVVPGNPTTYSWANAGTAFDSLGNEHVVTLYYSKMNPAVAGGTEWVVTPFVDGVLANGTTNPSAYKLQFNASGALDPATTAPLSITFPVTTGGASLQTIAVQFATPVGTSPSVTSTQFAGNSATNALNNDGYAQGSLQGLNINKQGIVQTLYTNGQVRTLGQIALATFTNQQGLKHLGGTLLGETKDSGGAQYNAPGSGPAGLVQSSAVEQSNVDLTGELVNMILAQRFFQGNAQTIRTQSEITQTVINLR